MFLFQPFFEVIWLFLTNFLPISNNYWLIFHLLLFKIVKLHWIRFNLILYLQEYLRTWKRWMLGSQCGRTKHIVNRALLKLIPMFCKTWLTFHWLITFNPSWNNMVVCAAFLILPNGISTTCCLQSYTYSHIRYI